MQREHFATRLTLYTGSDSENIRESSKKSDKLELATPSIDELSVDDLRV